MMGDLLGKDTWPQGEETLTDRTRARTAPILSPEWGVIDVTDGAPIEGDPTDTEALSDQLAMARWA
jgi:hypothetical protein